VRTLAAPDFAALRALLPEEIATYRADDALRPVTVITPGDLAREETRRDLAERARGTLGVTVTALGDWARDAAAGLSAGRELGEAGLVGLAARIVETRGETWRSPGLDRAAARALADLRRGGWTAASLAGVWRPAPDALRSELRDVLADFEDALAAEDLWDRTREERAATEALRARRDGIPRIFFGFHDLSSVQRDLVAAADEAGPVTLLVPGPGGPGETATVSLLDWARGRGPVSFAEGDTDVLLTMREGLFERPALLDPGPSSCELRTFPTEAAEVRAIARRLLREVDERSRAWDELLVSVPSDGPPPALFRRIFARAGIPLADRAGVPASRTEPGRRAIALARGLAAAPGEPDRLALDFLRSARELPDELVDRFHRAGTWTEAVARLRELFVLLFDEPAGDDVDGALDAIALVRGSRPARPREIARALAAALAATTCRDRIAEREDDACVLLVRPEGARALRRPFVWHAGLVEGAVRRLPADDPLLPDRIREGLAAHEHAGRRVPTRADRREEKLLLARFAFESAEETVVLSWAERARAGAEVRNPSAFLLELASARAGSALEPRDPAFRAIVPGPDPDEARRRPVDRTDLELAVLASGVPPSGVDLERLARDHRAAHVRGALRAADARWRPGRLTEWDGVLRDPRTIEASWRRVDPARRPPSPTTLETLANCPFAFLVERVLGLGREPEPEDDWSPLERGLVFHEVVETVYRRLKTDGLLPLDPSALDAALDALDAEIAGRRRPLDREAPGRRALRRATLAALRDDVASLLALEAHRPEEDRTVPTWFELSFGMRGDRPTFALDDGTRLPIRGKADRVDVRRDGAIDVVDFKTGKARVAPGRVTSTDGDKTSVHLQLPLYLDVVSSMLHRSPGRAILYHATGDADFEEVTFGAADLEARRASIGRLIAGALAQARRGWYPCTPGETCCRRRLASACGPGVAARFRRKRSDPDLAAHVARVEAADPAGDDA